MTESVTDLNVATENLTDRALLKEALAWLRGGEDRLRCRFDTNSALIRAIATATGDLRDDD